MPSRSSKPNWSALKRSLTDVDRAGLLALIQDLYGASRANQTFLHARFGLGEDVLQLYRAAIDRGLCPDFLRDEDTSVTMARKAITDYRRAVGRPDGLADLMVFFCERAAGFGSAMGLQDAGYYDSLVRMFDSAIGAIQALPADARAPLLARLRQVRCLGHELGYGVGDQMDELMTRRGVDVRTG